VTATSTAFGAARTICGDNVSIDRSVLFQQPQSPLRIVAVRGTAGFLVDARRDEHHAGARKRVVIAVPDVDLRAKRRAVAEVGCYGFRGFAGAIDEHDFTRAAPHHRGKCNGAADISSTDDAEFHWVSPRLACELDGPPLESVVLGLRVREIF
jgi:hypothetical protein